MLMPKYTPYQNKTQSLIMDDNVSGTFHTNFMNTLTCTCQTIINLYNNVIIIIYNTMRMCAYFIS